MVLCDEYGERSGSRTILELSGFTPEKSTQKDSPDAMAGVA